MEVSNQLKKQIIIEVLALIFLIGVIVYAFFAIDRSSENKVASQDGMVIVIDDSKYCGLKKSSDGVGLEIAGTSYTLTNNNKDAIGYKVVMVPNVHDEEVLKQVRVSTDDIYIETLTDLERISGGYVVAEGKLKAGITKIHLFKTWFKLDTDSKIASEKVDFEYRLVRTDK